MGDGYQTSSARPASNIDYDLFSDRVNPEENHHYFFQSCLEPYRAAQTPKTRCKEKTMSQHNFVIDQYGDADLHSSPIMAKQVRAKFNRDTMTQSWGGDGDKALL